MHVRAETIDSLPTFAEAFVHGRGLLIVSTFNEGEEVSPTKTIQHTVMPRDGRPIAIAVIWERWTNGPEEEQLTFVMVTVPPNKLIGTITDRMPAVLQPGDWPKWLGEETASLAEVKALLAPHEGDWDMHLAPRPLRRSPSLQACLF
jgi:putative SOS response-associated peptidase YedK